MSKAVQVHDFAKQVAAGKPAPVYLALGNEPLLLDETARLTMQLVDEATRDFNFDSYHGDDITVDVLASSLNELPMMAERRVILVKRAEELAPKIQNYLLEYTKNPSEDTVLVLLMEGDAKLKWKQKLSRQVTVIRCETPQKRELERWLQQRAAEMELTIEPDAMALMTESREIRLIDLAGELEKASLLLGESGLLTLEVLQQIWGLEPDLNIWAFFDRAAGGRLPDAWRDFKLTETEFEKDSRQAGFIMGQVSRRLRLAAKEREYDRQKIPSAQRTWSGNTANTWRMMSQPVKTMSLEVAQGGLEDLRIMDLERKSTSKKPGRMFERFLVKQAQRSRKP